MNKRIAIIILNWNGWKDSLECLESLRSLERQDFAIVVVDNASTDDSRAKLLEWISTHNPSAHIDAIINEVDIGSFHREFKNSEYIYIQSSSNGGFAAGNNLGIRLALQAGCEYVWLLNNDTIVDPAALVTLEQCMAQDVGVGMCGSMLIYYDDRTVVQAIGGVQFNFLLGRGNQLGQGLSTDDIRVVEPAKDALTYISGASLFVRSEFLRDVGLMEESYFLYFEEIDWAVRAKPKWKIAMALDSIVYHKEGGSIGTASRAKRSALSQYYLNRNLIRFYMLRMPWLIPVALLRVIREWLRLIYQKEHVLANTTFTALVDGLLMQSGPRKP
ncbi:glycosyltransferase family 2 protein [Sulfuriferula nivalis]|uniref:Rhamnosyltransferase n=1 Tax=Sulfuriferula nivalis TaxID=2675298 RepID=A0A809RL64_9PROT|nr:glycosyltransferase family 2 protein [Sulfuriferula nivalis]BBO99520.1 rhamnosyltransferase [Sulfuriferula nivalis]